MDEFIRRQDAIDAVNDVIVEYIPIMFGSVEAIPLETRMALEKIPAVNHICGYNIDYLVAFAMACRRAGVSDDDLKEFVSNYRYAFDMAQEEFGKNIRAVVDDLTKEEHKGEWDI